MIFFLLKAGKMVDYISTPVMGGFISGIAVTIILMQIPKILGGSSGTGELPELIVSIIEAASHINPVSVALGICSLAVIVVARKLAPKFPMVIVVMAAGVLLTIFGHIDQYGVKLLSAVEPGPATFSVSAISVSRSVSGSRTRTDGCRCDHGGDAVIGE